MVALRVGHPAPWGSSGSACSSTNAVFFITVVVLHLSVALAAANEACPADVAPGEWYASPNQVWQKGSNADVRCKSDKLTILSPADEISSTDRKCLSDKCYFTKLKTGANYCPLDSTSCGGVMPVPRSDENSSYCFDDTETCVDEWGICRCVKCPCGNSRRSGDACNLCQLPNCDDRCRKEGALRRGVVTTCTFGNEFYTAGFYQLLFPDSLAQPRIVFKLTGEDGSDSSKLRLFVTAYYTMCTSVETVLFSGNFTDCTAGVKETCIAHGIPTPCLVCDTAKLDIPVKSYLIGTLAEQLFRSISSAGLEYGCNYDNCKFYIQAIPLDFGDLVCTKASECLNDGSDEGESVASVEFLNDASTDSSYIVYLSIVVVGIFAILGVSVAAASTYRFKSTPDPQPLEPATLSWSGVSLNNIITEHFGAVEPGQFVAILGAVGAGKSTLLKILAGRWDQTQGDLLLNGNKVSAAQLRRAVGFVPQDPVCCRRDTVAEAIAFAATMGGGTFPDVGPLSDKLNTCIGTLSGGQRRLVDIYVELARRPNVLLLDEPTTGLDSETAIVLGRVLKEISLQIPVMVTVHQPRPDFASLFTDVMIFNRGGLALSAGVSEGHASAMDGLMKLCREVPDVKVFRSSVFDLVVELVSDGHTFKGQHGRAASQRVSVIPGRVHTSQQGKPRVSVKEMVRLRKTPWLLRQVTMLSVRNAKRALRLGPWKYFVTVLVAILIGATFFQSASDTQGLGDRFAAIFLILVFFALQGISAVGEMTDIYALVEHEIASHVYGRWVDALVRVLSQMAGQLPHALFMAAIAYPMVGFQTRSGRPIVFGLCIMAVAVSSACSAMICRGRNSGISGVMAAAGLNGFLCFFCGAFTNTESMPVPVDILLFFSPFRYSFEALVAWDFIGLSVIVPLNYEIEGSAKSVRVQANAEFYLETFSLPTSLGPDLDFKAKMVGVMSAFWIVLAFIVLALPARFFCRSNAHLKRPVAGEVSVNRLSQAIGIEQPSSTKVSRVAAAKCKDDNANDEKRDSLTLQDVIGEPESRAIEIEQPHGSRQFRFAYAEGKDDNSNDETMDSVTPQNVIGEPEPALEQDDAKIELDKLSELIWSGLSNPDVHGVSGGVRTGQLLGIVGPCGSGKTTLLKMLSGRVRSSSGTIRINGEQLSPFQLRKIVGYVPQEDCVCMEDTVSEALAFAEGGGVVVKARVFRNSTLLGAVEENSKELDQLMGSLSQGQRRIATVCAELARRPLVMMLDEPTSGLDTASSMKLIELLKGVSSRIPVIMTLHQPRAEIQQMMTNVLIMRRGESAVFMNFPDLRNAILLTDPEQAGTPAVTAEEDMMSTTLDLAMERLEELKGETYLKTFLPTAGTSTPRLSRARPPAVRLGWSLMKRTIRRTWQRQYRQRLSKVASWIFAGIFLGIAMSEQMSLTMEGVVARVGMFSIINSVVGVLSMSAIYEFSQSRRNIMHELESQVGSPFLYHLCQTLLVCAESVLCSLLFSVIFILWVPLNPDVGSRIAFIFLIFLATLACSMLAVALASMFSHNMAVNVYSGCLVFMFVVAVSKSATDPTKDIPDANKFFSVVSHFSFLRPVLEAQVENELVGLGKITVNFAAMEVEKISGKKAFDQLGFSRIFTGNIFIILAWIVLLWNVGALGLRRYIQPTKRAARSG